MLTISSNPSNIQEVESYLKTLHFESILHEDKYADILISLTEAVNNAIIHGNKKDETKNVIIHVKEGGDFVSFCVTDEGTGYNPNGVPDPTCSENIECCGGRGVYIMKALADHICFDDEGRTVEMTFNLKQQLA